MKITLYILLACIYALCTYTVYANHDEAEYKATCIAGADTKWSKGECVCTDSTKEISQLEYTPVCVAQSTYVSLKSVNTFYGNKLLRMTAADGNVAIAYAVQDAWDITTGAIKPCIPFRTGGKKDMYTLRTPGDIDMYATKYEIPYTIQGIVEYYPEKIQDTSACMIGMYVSETAAIEKAKTTYDSIKINAGYSSMPLADKMKWLQVGIKKIQNTVLDTTDTDMYQAGTIVYGMMEPMIKKDIAQVRKDIKKKK